MIEETRKTTIDNVHLPTLCSTTLIDVTLLSLPLVYCARIKINKNSTPKVMS